MQIHCRQWLGAPAVKDCRHLRSQLHLLVIISFSLPWRSFTLSDSLQIGLWLLRRLRPPPHALAFSRPPWGRVVVEFPNSSVKDILTRSCLLYAGRAQEHSVLVVQPAQPPPSPFGLGVSTSFPYHDSRRLHRFFCISVGQKAGRSSASGLPTPNFCPQASDPVLCQRAAPAV
jgi:hypothetical protein